MVNLIEDKRIRKASFHGYVLSETIRKAESPKSAVEGLSDRDLVDLALHYSVEQMAAAGIDALRLEDAMRNYTLGSAMTLSDSAFKRRIDADRETFLRYCSERAKFQSRLSECDLAVYRMRATGSQGHALEETIRRQTPEMHAQMNRAMIIAAQMAMDSE